MCLICFCPCFIVIPTGTNRKPLPPPAPPTQLAFDSLFNPNKLRRPLIPNESTFNECRFGMNETFCLFIFYLYWCALAVYRLSLFYFLVNRFMCVCKSIFSWFWSFPFLFIIKQKSRKHRVCGFCFHSGIVYVLYQQCNPVVQSCQCKKYCMCVSGTDAVISSSGKLLSKS